MGWGFLKKWTDYLKGEVCFCYERFVLKKFNIPSNFEPLDSSPEAILRDVKYALGNARNWLNLLPEGWGPLKGKKVLEIGPGVNFGAMLILACHGADVIVADRFLPPWDTDYHPKFYAALRDRMKDYWPLLDPTPLDRVLSQENYPPGSISLCSCSLERLSGISDQSVDLVFSNAVFEHLYDIKSAFSHLARITKPGGIGLHQVDFRDHRDNSRPLEHLLFKEEEFYGRFKARLGEFGNRYRPQEMKKLLEVVGFEVKEFCPDIFTDEEYLTEFLVRLRQARKSRYCDYPAEDLRFVSGRFFVVRKEA